MRGLSLIDVLVIAAVIALLVFVGSRDFARYAAPTPAPTPGAPASP